MLLSFLFTFSLSWREEAMIISAEIAFRQVGDSAHTLVQKVLKMNREYLARDSILAAWLELVEKPPLNTYNFNHWRFTRNPIIKDIDESRVVMHENTDDLVSEVQEFDNSLYHSSITQLWPYTLAFKSFFGLVNDIYSPVHNAELFSSLFPDGDNCGRSFFIEYNGANMSLYHFWETGCGRYTKVLPYSDDDWREIDRLVDEMRESVPYSSFHDAKTDYATIGNQSYNIAKEFVYNIEYGQKIGDDDPYVQKCREITTQRIVFAGYKLSVQLKKFNVPSFKAKSPASPTSSTEVMAWAAFAFFLPALVFSAWKFFTIKVKTE